MTKYLTNQQYSQAKARLTRAKKKGPEAVIHEVRQTLNGWDMDGYAWPDSWHDWQRAADDAEMELRYQR
jgi:hypothetical protein